MVLNDITKDYTQFIDLLNSYNTKNGFIDSAFSLINTYQNKINVLANNFLRSSKHEPDKSTLISGLNTLETSFSNQIANMSTSMRNITKFIAEIEHINFTSSSIKSNVDTLCESLNNLMDLTDEYAANRIRSQANTATFFKLIEELLRFQEVHLQIYTNYRIIKSIEEELLEEFPFEETDENPISYLDIRSFKPELNITSFTDDLQLLATCLQNLERLAAPTASHSIYIRKIESGSLKAVFGSNKIDFSLFPDFITSIVNAIRTMKLTPVEKEQIKAETQKTLAETALIQAQAEAQHIENMGNKLAIAHAQIDYLCEKLGLDPKKNPDTIEQIEHFCLPLISYIENNPVGSINGIDYDISKEVHLLEKSES